MTKIFIFIVLFAFIVTSSNSQWASNYYSEGDNSSSNAAGISIAVDDNENSYVTGYVYNVSTGFDIIIIKYNSSGDILWTRTFNGTADSEDKGFGLVVDNIGGIYIVGTTTDSDLSKQVVLLKYNENGNLLWSRSYGQTNKFSNDEGLDIAVSEAGNIFITGYTSDVNNNADIVVLKYQPNGTQSWVVNESGISDSECKGFSIVVDNFENAYVSGYSNTISGMKDAVLLKILANGSKSWKKTYNGISNKDDEFSDIAYDEDNEAVCVVGYTTKASATNTDVLLIKYDLYGNLLWNQTYNGNANSVDKGFGLVIESDNNNEIGIIGVATNITSGKDMLTLKYHRSGSLKWSRSYNGPVNGEDIGVAIDFTTSSRLVVTGKSKGENNNFDIMTIKYSNSGNELITSRYALSENTNDIPSDLVISDNNSAYLTGSSEVIYNSMDPQSFISTLMMFDNLNVETLNNNQSTKLELYQNYPNPFNPETNIKFNIGFDSKVKMTIYDILGRTVSTLIDQYMDKGSYGIKFSSGKLPSGIYIYELQADGYKDIKKMIIVR